MIGAADHEASCTVTGQPGTNVILLGASNVTIGFPLILRLLPKGLPEPIALYAAHGHGRSYGIPSSILGRELSGITQCGLWQALPPNIADTRPLAFVTDLGNDLIYSVDVPQISDWLVECLKRLTQINAQVVLTQLPMASIAGLSRWRFQFFRSLFFPGSGFSWRELPSMTQELHNRIQELADRFSAKLIEPGADWYGIDPIHIRRRFRFDAWTRMFSGWPRWNTVSSRPQCSLMECIHDWSLKPDTLRVRGRERRTPQPVREQPGISVRLF